MKEKIALLAITAALFVWFFRYDFQIVSAGGEGIAGSGYALNRITGTIYFVSPTIVRELKPYAPNPFDKFDVKPFTGTLDEPEKPSAEEYLNMKPRK